MRNKWGSASKIILAGLVVSLALSIWTLFVPHYGYGILSFNMMFPTWIITLILAVLVATLHEV